MENLKHEIERVAAGEPIEAVVIGQWCDPGEYWVDPDEPYGDQPDGRGSVPRDVLGTVVAWQTAAAWLDYEFDGGLGLTDCHPIYAWTSSRVIYVHEYDGATDVVSVPRHPLAGRPHFCGARGRTE